MYMYNHKNPHSLQIRNITELDLCKIKLIRIYCYVIVPRFSRATRSPI